MKTIIEIALIFTATWIAVQDFRDRLISVVLFVAMGTLLTFRYISFFTDETNHAILLSNYLFIAGQVLFLYIYFRFIRLKHNFFQNLFGLGDLCMMLCMALVFPLPQLLIYFILSYAAGIAFALLKNKQAISIPLAGFMGIIFSAILLTQLLFNYPILIQFA